MTWKNRNTTSVRGKTGDTNKRSEARAPVRAYAIRAREEATALDVIAGSFSSLIDPGSTHSYICTTLVNKKNLPVVSIDYTVKVTNSLGRCVLVNQICKLCSLKV